MIDETVPQETPSLHDTLSTNFEQAEAGILPTPDERARDEAGRFAKQEVTKQAEPVQAPVAAPALTRPTTWKRDYLPMWDKLAGGQALTPDEARKLAEYTNQRETEYKTGVSTYKTEAQNARELQDAVTPYLPELQATGTSPAQWIKDVGQIHTALSRGTPEQKINLFQELARRYGVPIAAVQQQGPVPPILSQILQPMGDMRGQIQALYAWKQQQEQENQQREISTLEGEVHQFASDAKYPHFEAVREDMARLLETGVARDLPQAYKMACRNNDEIYEAELHRADPKTSKTAVASKARAQAISPKSVTPSGSVTSSGPKDRRATLSEQFDAHGGGRV